MTPSVSVVVATYGRPEVLRVAVRSALLQSVPALEIVVIGDACDDRTSRALASLDGPIRYVNLPGRCGEQAIPNSAGSAIARGNLIAYLNQDDVWLADHLETSLRALADSGRAWHVGAARFALRQGSGGAVAFTDRSPPGRTIHRAFSRVCRYLEPVSSWVVSRELVAGVGWWRPAAQLYRTPVQDLALRLWRAAGEPSFGEVPTVLKRPGGGRGGGQRLPAYARGSRWHRGVAELLDEAEQDGGAALAAFAAPSRGRTRQRTAHVSEDAHGAGAAARWTARRMVGDRSADFYRRTGIDTLDAVYRAFRVPRGGILRGLLEGRTGEPELPDAGIDEMIAFARATGA